MKRLTRRQQEVLTFIEEWIRRKRYPPSVREIAIHFGLKSASGVHKHIKALVRKNYVAKDDFLSRSLRILSLPSVGSSDVPAETLLLAVTGVLEEGGKLVRPETNPSPLPVAERLVPHAHAAFALRIGGDHLSREGLRNGDYAIVMPRAPVRNGSVVLATLHALETVVRRFHREGDTVRLNPLTPDQPPAELPARDVHVQGVVAGIWRPFP